MSPLLLGRTWGDVGRDLDGEVAEDSLLLWLRLRRCFEQESANDDRRDLTNNAINMDKSGIWSLPCISEDRVAQICGGSQALPPVLVLYREMAPP